MKLSMDVKESVLISEVSRILGLYVMYTNRAFGREQYIMSKCPHFCSGSTVFSTQETDYLTDTELWVMSEQTRQLESIQLDIVCCDDIQVSWYSQ